MVYNKKKKNLIETHGKDGDPAVKEFNTTGICNPDKHYMVDISDKLEQIKAMVDTGKFFLHEPSPSIRENNNA